MLRLAVVVALILAVLAGIAIVQPETIDNRLTAWLQVNAEQGWMPAVLLVTALGSTPWALAVTGVTIVMLMMRRAWHDVVFVIVSVPGGILLNTAFKDIFDRARPAVDNRFFTFTGGSFPSGHAMAATVLYGTLAVILLKPLPAGAWRTTVKSAAAILIVTVALTRLYLGAHYLSDVIGGVAAGAGWIALCRVTVARFLSPQRL